MDLLFHGANMFCLHLCVLQKLSKSTRKKSMRLRAQGPKELARNKNQSHHDPVLLFPITQLTPRSKSKSMLRIRTLFN